MDRSALDLNVEVPCLSIVVASNPVLSNHLDEVTTEILRIWYGPTCTLVTLLVIDLSISMSSALSSETFTSFQNQFLEKTRLSSTSRRAGGTGTTERPLPAATAAAAAAAAAATPAQRTHKVSQQTDMTPAEVLHECTTTATSHFSKSMALAGLKQADFAAILITTLTRTGEPVHAATKEFLNLRDSEDLKLLLQKWRAQPQSLTAAGSTHTRRHSTYVVLLASSWAEC